MSVAVRHVVFGSNSMLLFKLWMKESLLICPECLLHLNRVVCLLVVSSFWLWKCFHKLWPVWECY